MPTTTAPAPTVKVGDFFVSSWGYDQTNVDFYRVVGLTASGKSVKVQKWTMAVDHSDFHDYVVANEGGGPVMVTDWSDVTPEMDYWEQQEAKKSVPSPVMTKRLRFWGESTGSRASKYSVSFSVNSYSNAYLWDGKPKYQTGYGLGH